MSLSRMCCAGMLCGLLWATTLGAAATDEPEQLERCSSPMTLEVAYGPERARAESRATDICGLDNGKFYVEWETPTSAATTPTGAAGRYRMHKGVLEAEIDLSVDSAPAIRWSGSGLRNDGRAITLKPEGAQGGAIMTMRMRPMQTESTDLFRVQLTLGEAAMAQRIADATGWKLSGLDTLGDSAVTFKFEIISLGAILPLINYETGRALWRLGEGEYRFVALRDGDRVAVLQKQASEAKDADDEEGSIARLEEIRVLGRGRTASDTPPDIIDSLIELARLRDARGRHAEAAEVWRELLAAVERSDRRPKSVRVAQSRARFGAALLRAGKRVEAEQVLRAAQSILIADADHTADEEMLVELPVAFASIGERAYAERLLDQALSLPGVNDPYFAMKAGDVAAPMVRHYQLQRDVVAVDRLIKKWGLALRSAAELDSGLGTRLVGDAAEAFEEGRYEEGVQLADTFVRLCQLVGMQASGYELLLQFQRTAGYMVLGDYAAAARSQRDSVALRMRRDGVKHRGAVLALLQLRQLQLMAGDSEGHAQNLGDLLRELAAARPVPVRTLDGDDRLDGMDHHSAFAYALVMSDKVHTKYTSKPDPSWLPALEARAAIRMFTNPEAGNAAFAEVQALRKKHGVDATQIEQRAQWFAQLQRRSTEASLGGEAGAQ